MRASPSSSAVCVCALALLCCAQAQSQEQRVEFVRIHVDPSEVLGSISTNFLGFGYETSAVAQSNFFSPKNLTMVQLYKNLSPHGLIRIGGIISDHTQYLPEGTPAVREQNGITIINQANLTDLGEFARATGWKVMWGLNLGSGSKEEAVQEALAVDAALGSSLQSFEIGNEVEALSRFAKSYEAYHSAYVDYKTAIRTVLPNASFSGPDSIGNLHWITNFTAAEARDIKLLTHHYYRGGASDKRTSLERLLQRDESWENRLEKLRQICRDQSLAFRINEVNSFSGGGKAGVSDTFGSALWCLDYMFILASYGCAGVNMETDINQLGFISHYSPVVHDAAGHCSARPEYYGMLAFAMAGKGNILKLTLEKTDVNLTAYATSHDDGSIWMTAVNKDFARDANLETVLPDGYSSAMAVWLRAPSTASKDHVTLAGTEVADNGSWNPGSPENVVVVGGATRLLVPHASALLLQLRRN